MFKQIDENVKEIEAEMEAVAANLGDSSLIHIVSDVLSDMDERIRETVKLLKGVVEQVRPTGDGENCAASGIFEELEANFGLIDKDVRSIREQKSNDGLIRLCNESVSQSMARAREAATSLRACMYFNLGQIVGNEFAINKAKDELYVYALANALEAKDKGDLETAINEAAKASGKYARGEIARDNAKSVMKEAIELQKRREAHALEDVDQGGM